MDLRRLVEEFLYLNERKNAGIATVREQQRWHELRLEVLSWRSAEQGPLGVPMESSKESV